MKTLSQIYTSIKDSFFKSSKLEIQEGTAVDFHTLAVSEGILAAYEEIEANKNPHIYTNLTGEDIDSAGLLVNCPREANETDQNYLYRLMNWTMVNASSNITAIEIALMNMTYASSATYVPYTEGVGTGTVYVIPRTYDGTGPDNALAEARSRVSAVSSPGSYVNYVVPTKSPVRIIAYISAEDGDLATIQANIKSKIMAYVNGIPVGDFLSLGEINKIGINEPNVNYFNIVQVFVDGTETTALKVMQKIHSKMLLDDIIWWTAVA